MPPNGYLTRRIPVERLGTRRTLEFSYHLSRLTDSLLPSPNDGLQQDYIDV